MSLALRAGERAFVFGCWLGGGVLVALVATLLGYLLFKGGPALGVELFFGDVRPLDALAGRIQVWDGIFPATLGTLSVVLLANLIAQPVGIAAGIFLSEYLHGTLKGWLCFAVDVLAGIPSIIMGLFGFALILFLRATFVPEANTSLLLAGCCLALLVLPYVISTTRASLESLTLSQRLVGPALGFTQWQNIQHVLLPASRRGMLGGSMLALGRSAEDTAVIMLTGVVANAGVPRGLTDKFEALPFFIFYHTAEYRGPEDIARAFGAALVLLVLSAGLFFLAHRQLVRQERKESNPC